MSTNTANEVDVSDLGSDPIIEVVVTIDAGTGSDPSLLQQLPDWADIFEDEDTPIDPVQTIDLSKPKERKAWWRSMSTSAAIATLAWEKAIQGTNFTKLVTKPAQWIIVAIVPSDAWFRPLRDLLSLQQRALVHDAIPQARRRGNDETDLDRTVRKQGSIFVLASDSRNIAPAIRSSADLTIVIPAPDIDLIRRLLLRSGRGPVPRRLDPGLIAGLDFADLCTSIRPGRRVSETIAALARASAERISVPAEAMAPELGSTRAFGAAGIWGQQVARDIADYRAGKISWGDVDRGAVVYGPPGTGKTLFARSLAQHCKVPIIIATISDYFANSAGDLDGVVKAQREIFARATALKPSILFLDEIDAIPDRNSLSPRGRDWWMPVINDFLTLLDSATSARAGVVVIGATNRIEAIDPAILRPGRLERAIELSAPDADGLVDILKHHLGEELEGIDLLNFARRQQGATGATAMEWVRSAKRIARTANRSLELADIEAVLTANSMMSQADLHRAALHEAGHAVVLLQQGRRIESIILGLNESTGGRVRAEPRSEKFMTKPDIIAECIVLLAGRAAEDELLRCPGSGSGGSPKSDLARATELMVWAHQSVGFGKDLVYGGPTTLETSSVDPRIRPMIAKELAAAYAETLEIVRKNRREIVAIADALIRTKFLSGEDVAKIVSGGGRLASKN